MHHLQISDFVIALHLNTLQKTQKDIARCSSSDIGKPPKQINFLCSAFTNLAEKLDGAIIAKLYSGRKRKKTQKQKEALEKLGLLWNEQGKKPKNF